MTALATHRLVIIILIRLVIILIRFMIDVEGPTTGARGYLDVKPNKEKPSFVAKVIRLAVSTARPYVKQEQPPLSLSVLRGFIFFPVRDFCGFGEDGGFGLCNPCSFFLHDDEGPVSIRIHSVIQFGLKWGPFLVHRRNGCQAFCFRELYSSCSSELTKAVGRLVAA